MDTRFLGSALIVSTIVVVLDGFRRMALGLDGVDDISSIAYIVWGIGGICGLVGLMKLGALGSSSIASALGFVPVVGFGSLVLGDTLKLSGVLSDTGYGYMISAGWVLLLAGMLVVGVITIASGSWHGWQRFVPLGTALTAPVALAIGFAIGSITVAGMFALAFWVVLGYVVATGEPTPAVRQA